MTNTFNSLAQPEPQGNAPEEWSSQLGLFDLLDILLERKWQIIFVVAVTFGLSVFYSVFAPPVYEANTVIQVEDVKSNPFISLQADNILEVKSGAVSEIEILRSRNVIGKAVENLLLDIEVYPRYLPLIGAWLPRVLAVTPWKDAPSWRGYVISDANITMGYFKVPDALRGVKFTVKLGDNGYQLLGPNDENIGTAVLGQAFAFSYLDQKCEILISNAYGAPGSEFEVVVFPALPIIEGFQQGIKISEVGKQSGIIRSSFEGTDPAKLVRILNEIANVYVRQNVERKAAEAEKSLTFLSRQLPELKSELESSERVFNQFRAAQGFFDLGSEATDILSRSAQFKVSLVEARNKRAELETRYTAKHPSIQALDTQIKLLQGELSALESKSRGLPTREQDSLRLMRDVKVNSELYTNLLNNAQQLRLVKEGKIGTVRLIDPAMTPDRPVRPVPLKIVSVGTFLGLLLGCAFAFARYFLRPSIRTSEEIEQALGLSVYTTVPLSQKQVLLEKSEYGEGQTKLLSALHPNDIAVESLRGLRTAVQFIMGNARNPIILVTGPTPAVGKSFISANLACVLAAAGKKVLLVDGDMRLGHIHKILGVARGKGFSELLSGQCSLADVTRKELCPNLDFVSAGATPPNPSELIMSTRARQIIGSLYQDYDHVIIDSPPVLVVSDAASLASEVGRVLLVARADLSTLKELGESVRRLRMATSSITPGIVFNGMDIFRRRYGYYYGYSKNYQYYSK